MSNIFKSGSGSSASSRFSFDKDWNQNDRKKDNRDKKREYKKPEYKSQSSSEKNQFSFNESKKIVFSLQNDFPELGSNTNNKKNTNIVTTGENKKFSDIINPLLKEVDVEKEEEKIILEEGSVCYMREKNNKIRIEYGPNTNIHKEIPKKKEVIVTTEEIMHNIIDVILKNREKYKEEFIELQGEYEYERIYGKEKPKEEEQEEEETEEEYYYYGENDVYDY